MTMLDSAIAYAEKGMDDIPLPTEDEDPIPRHSRGVGRHRQRLTRSVRGGPVGQMPTSPWPAGRDLAYT